MSEVLHIAERSAQAPHHVTHPPVTGVSAIDIAWQEHPKHLENGFDDHPTEEERAFLAWACSLESGEANNHFRAALHRDTNRLGAFEGIAAYTCAPSAAAAAAETEETGPEGTEECGFFVLDHTPMNIVLEANWMKMITNTKALHAGAASRGTGTWSTCFSITTVPEPKRRDTEWLVHT